ncbi:hypothetical protein BDF14DRAFT_1863685 [Spinellus fusiger]|nr:hypothetical protein BDF14DRAFT_1863685 [Spinellus fusiger]
MAGVKSLILSLSLAQIAAVVSATASTVSGQPYWLNFQSNVNPLNISYPTIQQTVSYDVVKECSYYDVDPSLIAYNATEWPSVWDLATSNGMNSSTEFLALYNSIDWTSAPNISVRQISPAGGLDFTGYDTVLDPDCWWSVNGCTIPKLPDVYPDIYECPEPETWGLTYDDGPNCSHNAFYDYLQEKKLRASMFYIGSNVVDWPYGAMRGVKDNHHVASHTWSHPLVTTLTNQEVLAELYYTQKAIKLTTGLTPRFWRPPFGDIDDRVRWIASQLNLTAIIWNLDTDDWEAAQANKMTSVEKNYQDFITMGKNGTFSSHGNIVLTHEINNTTMSLAIEHLPQIMSSFKNVVNVATCQNITNPYFEDTVTFPTFAEFFGLNTTGASPSASASISAAGVVSASISAAGPASTDGSVSNVLRGNLAASASTRGSEISNFVAISVGTIALALLL